MLLKGKIKSLFEFYKQSINNQKFILIFILLFIASLYGVFGLAQHHAMQIDYLTGILNIFLNNYYVTIIVFITFLNTFNIYNVFSENINYIIRLKSKKNYLIELIKNIIFSNTMLLLVNLALILIGLNIFNKFDISSVYYYYNLPSIVYIIYLLIKQIIIINFLSVIIILLAKIMNEKISFLIGIAICAFILSSSFDAGLVINSIFKLPLFIGSYLLSYNYGSFVFEIICFIIYCLILYIFIIGLVKLAIKFMKAVIKWSNMF